MYCVNQSPLISVYFYVQWKSTKWVILATGIVFVCMSLCLCVCGYQFSHPQLNKAADKVTQGNRIQYVITVPHPDLQKKSNLAPIKLQTREEFGTFQMLLNIRGKRWCKLQLGGLSPLYKSSRQGQQTKEDHLCLSGWNQMAFLTRKEDSSYWVTGGFQEINSE